MHTCCTAIQISFASLESKVANLRNFGIQICVSPQDSNPACGWKDSTCIENAFNTSDKRKKVLVCHEDLRCNMCASPSAEAGTQGPSAQTPPSLGPRFRARACTHVALRFRSHSQV